VVVGSLKLTHDRGGVGVGIEGKLEREPRGRGEGVSGRKREGGGRKEFKRACKAGGGWGKMKSSFATADVCNHGGRSGGRDRYESQIQRPWGGGGEQGKGGRRGGQRAR